MMAAWPGQAAIIGQGQNRHAGRIGDIGHGRSFRRSQRTNHANRTKAHSPPCGITCIRGVTGSIDGQEFNPRVVGFEQRQFGRLLQRLAKRRLWPRKRQQKRYPVALRINGHGARRAGRNMGGLRSTGAESDKQDE